MSRRKSNAILAILLYVFSASLAHSAEESTARQARVAKERQATLFTHLTSAAMNITSRTPDNHWSTDLVQSVQLKAVGLYSKIYGSPDVKILPEATYELITQSSDQLNYALSLIPINGIIPDDRRQFYISILTSVSDTLQQIMLSKTPYETIDVVLITKDKKEEIQDTYYIWYVVAKFDGMPAVKPRRTNKHTRDKVTLVKDITYRFWSGTDSPTSKPQDVSVNKPEIEIPVPETIKP